MQLPREFFDSGDDAGCGTVHGITNYSIVAVADGMDNLPTGDSGELFHFVGGVSGLRLCEDEKIRLQLGNFFEVHLRPVLRGVDDGNGAGVAQSVSEKSVLAGGNERLGPNDKEDALWGNATQPMLKIVEAMLHVTGDRRSSLRNTEDFRECFYGRENLRDGVRISGIRRDPQLREGLGCFETVEFGDENEIGME